MLYSTRACGASLLSPCLFLDMFPRAAVSLTDFHYQRRRWLVVNPFLFIESTTTFSPIPTSSTLNDGLRLKETPTDDDFSGLSPAEGEDALESSEWYLDMI